MNILARSKWKLT